MRGGSIMTGVREASALARALLDFALPPRCPGCGSITPGDYQFCTTCWLALEFLGPPGCIRCNMPMPFEGMICAPCMDSPPRHDGVHAAVAYGEISRRVTLRLKYGRRISDARTMAVLMARHMAVTPETLVIPVPLHYWRIWQRGYNQSALIAGYLVRLQGGTLLPDGLKRVRRTRSLSGLGKKQRAKEVRGAFRVPEVHRSRIRGAHILLVDDVFTSGATVNACARVLKAKGAKRVEVICWARVVHHD
ncbi:MAG: ComF family protein [Alphaproteobacteria bacterium]|nr:ComF family protein [Alphaproteobacteria bacterium]MDE2042151.1 ComF family protein [Alphaproteobacteria bacterium]MDE2340791.1 ComF family protein [Alphaproteobacteria bacterium]